jgi:hypothetical protein
MTTQLEVMPIISDYMPSIDTKWVPLNLGDLCRINEEFERIYARRMRMMAVVTEIEFDEEQMIEEDEKVIRQAEEN